MKAILAALAVLGVAFAQDPNSVQFPSCIDSCLPSGQTVNQYTNGCTNDQNVELFVSCAETGVCDIQDIALVVEALDIMCVDALGADYTNSVGLPTATGASGSQSTAAGGSGGTTTPASSPSSTSPSGSTKTGTSDAMAINLGMTGAAAGLAGALLAGAVLL